MIKADGLYQHKYYIQYNPPTVLIIKRVLSFDGCAIILNQYNGETAIFYLSYVITTHSNLAI